MVVRSKKRIIQPNGNWTKEEFEPNLSALTGTNLLQQEVRREEVIRQGRHREVLCKSKSAAVLKTRGNDQDALSVVLSAAYFTSQWEHSFVKATNSFGTFYHEESVKRKVEYMNVLNEKRYYAETEDMQVLSLRYKDTSYALNIFLSKDRFGFDALRTKLIGSLIQHSLSQLKATYMKISIPKIKIESEFKLKSVLKSMGISELFSDHCDLTGITKTSQLKISSAEHRAVLEVTEDGTSEEGVQTYFKPTLPPTITVQPISFIADHPFIFVLTKDRNPLFIGQYV
ncbi:serine proteinase inhibitor [Necator americanus]|uniref:Serine proteinase inhibitor n=1 Tax=Necator americanus TaxID=51031 RepID=W2U0V9_NECAM|nr:serine proteinase inhibitor [Necator americanus]ETN86996.1 serine proteinase inhibitor [Necator americanus]